MVHGEQSSQSDESSVRKRRFMGFKLENTLKFLSSLLLPLAVGVFTSVLTIQQQRSSEKQREADREASKQQLEQERNLNAERYKNEIFKDYITEMATLLENHNGSLTSDKTIANIARSKTLNIFRELDALRNVRIIRFLYEAGQLSSAFEVRPLDLSTAELHHVNFRDAAVNKKKLDFLYLTSVFLYNVAFTELEMEGNNFTNTEFHLANFRFSRTNTTKFISAFINSTDFTRATLENVDFEKARLNNTDFFNTTLRTANFDSALLQDTNFQFARFIGPVWPNSQISVTTDFSNTTLRNANFSFTFMSKAYFQYATLENVNFAFSELFNVDFSLCRLIFRLNFSNALLFGVAFPSSIIMENIDFSRSQLVGPLTGSFKSANVDFSFANLTNSYLSSSEFTKANFSSSILRRANFGNAKMANVDLSQVTCVTTRFDGADLSYANFENANLKNASFVRATLTNAIFNGTNLYKIDLTNSIITDKQLRTAFSIQDTVLPNGTVVQEKSLIRNGEAVCNVSVTEDWALENGMVNTSTSNLNKYNCHFHLQSYATGATLSQRVNLSGKWDFISWPYSKAVLTAHMSTNVFLVLTGLDSRDRIVVQTTLSKSNDRIDIVLQNTMKELEVVINFNPVINQANNNATWCDNVKLFIIYGTYKELIRGK